LAFATLYSGIGGIVPPDRGGVMSEHLVPRRRAKVRRGLKAIVLPMLLGATIAAFTLGALSRRVTDNDDLLPAPAEAAILGAVFAIASFPRPWAIVARAAVPVPTFFVFLSVLAGRTPPLPFGIAFTSALCYALFFTALSSYFAERPRILRLQSRRSETARRPPAHA
jgi:hypothetical protein